MEEEDETHSIPSPGDSPLSPITPSSPPNLPTNDVTVAIAKKPQPPVLSSQSPSGNALALVVHTPGGGNRNGRGGGSGGGGGRDDCWSEEATKVLIDAWGDRFSEPGKGTLKQQQWKEVAEIVNDSRQCKYPKTDIQCKNRIDTVKKKYKQEKAKIASGDGPSKWIFFKKLENLIGGTNTIPNSRSLEKAPMGVLVNSRSNLYKRQAKGNQNLQQQQGGGDLKRSSDSMRWHFRKRSTSETESESEPEPPSPDSAESLPPPQPLSLHLPKRLRIDKPGGGVGVGGSGVGDVAKAILGFTEAYEKAETAKLELMVELEKERMKFTKEMELQRMQFLKTQLKITQSNQEEEERSRRGERRILDDDDDRNVKNNGDVSS